MENETHRMILGEVEKQVDVQLGMVDGLDTKLSVVLGFCGVIISLVLQAEKLPFGFKVTGLIILSLTMFVALLAYGARDVRRDPAPHPLVEYYWNEDETAVSRALVAGMVRSYSRNASALDFKAKALNVTLCGTALGVVVLVASAFVVKGV